MHEPLLINANILPPFLNRLLWYVSDSVFVTINLSFVVLGRSKSNLQWQWLARSLD
jgi:branched-subunit amino acid transport protein